MAKKFLASVDVKVSGPNVTATFEVDKTAGGFGTKTVMSCKGMTPAESQQFVDLATSIFGALPVKADADDASVKDLFLKSAQFITALAEIEIPD